MGNPISTQQKEELLNKFSIIDKNADGLISKVELYEFFKAQNQLFSTKQIQIFYYWMDENADGFLNFGEFIECLSNNTKKRDIKVFTKNIFNDFDSDKDGCLDYLEYALLDSYLPEPSSEEKLIADFEAVDVNKNGKISMKELIDKYSKDYSTYLVSRGV